MADLDDELFALAGGDEDADVEEGEASSVAASSPNSLGSDAMDESDSEREEEAPAARDSDVLYPLEGKYRDLKDKAYIQGLSQLEREEILGQRAEEMSKAQFYAQVGQRAAQQNKKRKADSDEPEDSGARRAVKPRVNDKLEAYKKDREQRGQQRDRHTDDRRGNRRRSSSDSRRGDSDVDAEGESEVDYDERDRKAAAREELPANVTHFDAVRVGRGFLGVVCFYPGFDEAMSGAYGRIGVGQDSQRRTLYKMAQIKGFATGKPYVFEGKNGKRVATDQYVVCQYGAVKKEYQFQFLSNQHFTESDLDAYKQALAEANMKVPTQTILKKKFDDLKALESRLWTDADINARIAKMAKFAHLLEKKSENPAPRIPTQSEVAAARLAEINRQSKRAETERIRNAQLEERQQKLQARKRAELEARKKKAAEEEAKKAQEESAQKGHLEVDALFDGGDSSRGSTPKPQEPPKKKTERKGLPTFRKPKMDDDIIASMDIGIDIEI